MKKMYINPCTELTTINPIHKVLGASAGDIIINSTTPANTLYPGGGD